MLKKMIMIGFFGGLVLLLVVGAVNRTLAKNESEVSGEVYPEHLTEYDQLLPAPVVSYTSQEQNLAMEPGLEQTANNPGTGLYEFIPSGDYAITKEEIGALIFMREEEKLAHDVYQAMYALWGKPIFQNISYSEQTHSEAVLALLYTYGLPDPASDQPGVFSDPDLQKLYDQLVAQGSQSQTEALRVGAAIEEIDILDLQARLEQISNPEIQQVFTSLLLGSGNHLKAFSAILAVEAGAAYQPQYLSADAYQVIIAQAGAGGGAGQGRGAGNGRRAAP